MTADVSRALGRAGRVWGIGPEVMAELIERFAATELDELPEWLTDELEA